MVTFQIPTVPNKTFYIDGRLQGQFDRKIIPNVQKKDKDFVFIISGAERCGKSVMAQSLAAYFIYKLGTHFDLSNICMTPKEFKDKVMAAKKNEVVIYDEAYSGMGSQSAMNEVNKLLVQLMMEMGQKNLIVFIVLPNFFMLNKYAAIFRSKGLFHVYERKNKRGFWVYYNEKRKLRLYIKGKKDYNYNVMKFPRTRGRFTNKYLVDEAEYRDKKRLSFTEKKRETRSEKHFLQRNALIKALHEVLKMKSVEISELIKKGGQEIPRATVREIINSQREDNTLKREGEH